MEMRIGHRESGYGSGLLRGYRIRLRPIEPDEATGHHPWDLGGEPSRRGDTPWLLNGRERERAPHWPDGAARTGHDGDAAQFLIETIAGQHAGVIGTHDCDRRNGTFSYGIAIRAECQRQSFGAEAILLVCRYYFEELRYQKVSTGVYSYNEPSLRLHERLGFECEGCLRRMIFSGGCFYDRVLFGLTAEEFAARHATSLPRAGR